MLTKINKQMYFSLLVNASTNGTFLYSVSQWKDPTNKQTNVCVCVSQALLCHTHTGSSLYSCSTSSDL